MSGPAICLKGRKQKKDQRAGKDFNKNGHFWKTEIKHFSPFFGD
jgi:hypothetical protein